jgi:hypothetical protein
MRSIPWLLPYWGTAAGHAKNQWRDVMQQHRVAVLVAIVLSFAGVAMGQPFEQHPGNPTVALAPPDGRVPHNSTLGEATQLFKRLPLLFVPEQPSPSGAMAFAVRGREASVWLSDSGLAYRLHPANEAETHAAEARWVVALDLVGATPRPPVGRDPLPTRVSHFKGPKAQWRTDLPSFSSLVYREPWPGVDLVVSGTDGRLKSSFVVRPGADPGMIRLAYRGVTAARLEPDGSLVVDTPLGSIREEAPVAYQEVGGRRVEVPAAFRLEPDSEPGRQGYRFWVGHYDPTRELVVDPVTLVYCGYIGGSESDHGYGIAVDAAGNAYVAGLTASTEEGFPLTIGPDLGYNGGFYDAFVAKLDASGTVLEYCGYIGGSDDDFAFDIAVDAAGNAYVAGVTYSTEASFPVMVGPDLSHNGRNDAFVARVNPTGTALDYCGFVGGSGWDYGTGIAVDSVGSAFITGYTSSSELTFPETVGPDLTHNGNDDAFVAKVNVTGTMLDYCGYIGGSDWDHGYGIAVDAGGNAYVTGDTRSDEDSFPVLEGPDDSFNGASDAFVAKVNPTGTVLVYAGYLGGSDWDRAFGIAVDTAGRAFVTGHTYSSEATLPVMVGLPRFPDGSSDAFVAEIHPNGKAAEHFGCIGGSGADEGSDIAIDPGGHVYIVGTTNSDEFTFPVVNGPDLSYNGGLTDLFVARVKPEFDGLDYCGYIGGLGDDDFDAPYGSDIAVDTAGNAYVTGSTTSTEASFPIVAGPDLTFNGGGRDAFVARVIAFLFSDGFESGDTKAWSLTVP